jgi:hypothetical protein
MRSGPSLHQSAVGDANDAICRILGPCTIQGEASRKLGIVLCLCVCVSVSVSTRAVLA